MSEYRKVERDLRKYKGLKVFIQNAKEQIELLQNDIQGATAITYDGTGGKTNAFHSVVESEVMNRDEKIKKLEKKISQAQELVDRVDRSFEKVLNDIEKNVLVAKYVDNQPWFKVAAKVNMSERQCKRIRTEAVERLIIPFFGDK